MSHLLKTILTAAVTLGVAGASQATTNLVQNGGFEQTTRTDGSYGIGSLYPSNNATGWTTTGYNFVFQPNTADSVGADGEYGNMKLWGPANGANNGLTSSPAGGNFLAADGAYQTEAITQAISGLTVGKQYEVSFYWAGAQQYGYNGETTENWTVSLGNQSFTTPTVTNSDHGFTGWQQASYIFTADNTTETLSFLAHGTPNGEPPFSLLDGVSMGAVPEPASWAMMIVGFGAIGGAMRYRKRTPVAA